MPNQSLTRILSIKRLKFFRFLVHVGVCASILSVFLSTGLALIGCVSVTALCAALADLIRIDLEFSASE